MLSISSPIGAGQGAYYSGLAVEDYYLKGGEPPGRWLGTGTESLGLSGRVEDKEFFRLFNGFSRDGKKPLVQNAGSKDRQCGWDLTFSAPKSVSTLWSQAPEDLRKEIEAAHHRAVQKTFAYLEQVAGSTRRGKGGGAVEAAKLIAAEFQHGTSRAQEPNLHSHLLLFNLGIRADGTTGSVQSRDFFKLKMTLGAYYRVELSNELRFRHGFETERVRTWFELSAVPKALCEIFSTRRKEIEAVQRETGNTGAVAAKVAALSTRQVKEHVPRGQLFDDWRAKGEEHGWSTKQVLEILDRVRRVGPAERPKSEKEVTRELAAQAIKELTTQQSYFTERQLTRALLEGAQGRGISADNIIASVSEHLGTMEVVPIGEIRGEKHFTTRAIRDQEKELLADIENGVRSTAHQASNKTVREIFARHERLNDEQRVAVRHVTQEAGSIKLVSGMAGTGKSTMLGVAREIWEAEGFKVMGTAIAGKAAQGLREGSGIESTTIAKLLKDLDRSAVRIETNSRKLFPKAPAWSPLKDITAPKLSLSIRSDLLRLDSKTILVVDEAGMVPTATMKALTDACAKVGAKLVLVGDARQLQPIDAGGPFAAMEKRLGAAELTKIQRQKDPWDRVAVHLFAEGAAANALELMARRGFVHVQKDREAAKKALFSEWKSQVLKQPEKAIILTGTKEEAQDLNRRAQDERLKAKILSRHSVLVNGIHIHQGDRVLFTENNTSLGVMNGNFGTATKIEKNTLFVRLDEGRVVKIPLAKYDSIQLGYASTTHKAQGMTVDKAFVLMGGPMQDREMSYVQASRARFGTHIYTDKLTAGKGLEDLARAASTSRQKELAHEIAAKADAARESRKPESLAPEPTPRDDARTPDFGR